MFEKNYMIYIYAETPIHPGSGTSIGDVVDLPIQRERHTEFPMIQGSSLKGVLRRTAQTVGLSKPQINTLFGYQDAVGGMSVTDAKILAFPVRSLKGVFGWVTCPLVLDRYKRDLKIMGNDVKWSIPELKNDNETIVPDPQNSNLIVEDTNNRYIYIEELQLKIVDVEKESKTTNNVKKIASTIAEGLPKTGYENIKTKIQKDLIIISDTLFRDLISLTTEIVARIRIDENTGTVDKRTGGLWYEEYLPADTILYSLVLTPSKIEAEIMDDFVEKINELPIQIGGNETIGKGFTRISVVKKEDENAKNT